MPLPGMPTVLHSNGVGMGPRFPLFRAAITPARDPPQARKTMQAPHHASPHEVLRNTQQSPRSCVKGHIYAILGEGSEGPKPSTACMLVGLLGLEFE